MITLIKNGLKKKVATGYSWKALCFGCLYPLFRGDYKGATRHFMYATFTLGFSIILVPFMYNRTYLKQLLHDGYKPFDVKDELYLVDKFDYKS